MEIEVNQLNGSIWLTGTDVNYERIQQVYMNMNDYQKAAASTAVYQDLLYPITSLIVESAELGDLFIKPYLRGDEKEVDRKEIISEAGDVLWNLAAILTDHDITLGEVAHANLEKLADREARGVLKGSGGDR